jgi:transcriptional regulator of acetoin/glycerol metabolism
LRFVDSGERAVLAAVAALADGNPFGTERVRREEAALGSAFVRTGPVWHAEADLHGLHPNVTRLGALVEEWAPKLRDRLVRGARAAEAELADYEAFARYLLYQRHERALFALVESGARGEAAARVGAFRGFAADAQRFLALPGVAFQVDTSPALLFAWGFQIRRAFHHTFRRIHGGSMPAAELRARVWQSIFTHDQRRYRRSLMTRMADVPTLVVGESGTGKELVASAIALSRFVPFDPERQRFVADWASAFHAVNLSALSPALIESELFGHRRGSFTGAVEDRAGWFETCGPHGSVFLDEIGELEASVQVKLLRLLQTRRFQRIGETEERRFEGKVIAATNRDPGAELAAERLRADFYYRLCADRIETPTLRAQLADSPEDLHNLVSILARRIAGEEEAPALAAEVEAWVARELGPGHPWPGNVRELEQCVRSVLLRGEYRPVASPRPRAGGLESALAEGRLSADELLVRYCTQVYAATGSYEETGRRLGLDRRTVKRKIDRELLQSLRASG